MSTLPTDDIGPELQPTGRITSAIYRPARLVFSNRTLQLMWFDLLRLRARVKRWGQSGVIPATNKLHVGCGDRRLPLWFNVDVVHSDYDIDLGCGRLPWRDSVFNAVVSQHVIEHLELGEQLIPLLNELYRVMTDGAEIWLSCPDLEKVCRSYVDRGMADLLEDRSQRDRQYSLENIPTQHLINDLFHQFGQHKNLYDFGLLEWCLQRSNFTDIERVAEADLLKRFPEFPVRNDDLQSLYVRATKA